LSFFKTFNIKIDDVICFTGAGGKTTLMTNLAIELGKHYSVLVTTTTKLSTDELRAFDHVDETGRLFEGEEINIGVYASAKVNGEKCFGVTPEQIEVVKNRFDVVLIEDGSSRKQLKGWQDREPVIPSFTTKTIGVIDSSSLGITINEENIHRCGEFCKITGTVSGEFVTKAHLEKIIAHENGLFKDAVGEKILFMNRASHELYTGGIPVIYEYTHKVDAVIMAAGLSSRMGENKLLLDLDGITVFECFLNNLPSELFENIVLVYSDVRVADLAPNTFIKIKNKTRDKSETIRLGLEKCENAVMFFTADQPFLEPETTAKLLYNFRYNSDKIIIPVSKDDRRNPVIFPKSVIEDFNGVENGREVIELHPEKILTVQFDNYKEFFDIDTRKDYEEAKKWKKTITS